MTENKYSTQTFDALVALAHSLRPTWETEGIRNAIRTALARQPMPTLADLSYALVRLAIDPTIVAPVVLGMDGPHWHTTSAQHAAPALDRKCQTCHGYHNRLPCPGPVQASTNRVEDLRAELFAAKRQLCPHGVPWRACHQHDGHVVAGEVVNEEAS